MLCGAQEKVALSHIEPPAFVGVLDVEEEVVRGVYGELLLLPPFGHDRPHAMQYSQCRLV